MTDPSVDQRIGGLWITHFMAHVVTFVDGMSAPAGEGPSVKNITEDDTE